MLLGNEKDFTEIKKTSDSFTYELQQHNIKLWLPHKYLSHKKSMYGLSGDSCLIFPTKAWLYSLLISYWSMAVIF